MYQNIHITRLKNAYKVHLWDDADGYSEYIHKTYAYVKNTKGKYLSLYGDKVKKVDHWSKEDLQAGKIFESDIPPETRVLIDKYGESDEVSINHRELYFDIETEVTQGFPDKNRVDNKITSIALYDKSKDAYCVFITSEDNLNYIEDNVTVESFDTEELMLHRFYEEYVTISPTILSGWNIDGFDVPYLYNRTNRLFGEEYANSLSPIGIVQYNEYSDTYKIAGVSCLDYLALYKKFAIKQQSSYQLGAIGQLEVDTGKIEYRGSLNDLYKNDIKKFIKYNLNDVVIIKKLDDKLKYIEIAMGIAHIGHVPYDTIYHSSRYLDGAILTYLKKNNIIAPNRKQITKEAKDSHFSGAYVKEPIPGRYDWVYDLDLTSMYPSIIMSLNISPETKIGKFENWDDTSLIDENKDDHIFIKTDGTKYELTHSKMREILDNNEMTISSNGVMYDNDRVGVIPTILNTWFDQRVHYRKLMAQYDESGDIKQRDFYDKRQHVQKIILNSLYGVLGLSVFRFYDIDNAEATTLTGQALIKYTQKMANYYYNNELNDDKDHVIYTDTDSIYCSAVPIIKNRFPNIDVSDDKIMTEKILDVTSNVQTFINKSYDMFADKLLNCKSHKFNIKQEVISKSAFWVTKKRYGQWIINDGGTPCNKLDVKGLDIVKSNFPVSFRGIMTKLLNGILNHDPKSQIDDMLSNFKMKMKTLPLSDIASPTGVNNMKKFKHKPRTIYNSNMIFTKTKNEHQLMSKLL